MGRHVDQKKSSQAVTWRYRNTDELRDEHILCKGRYNRFHGNGISEASSFTWVR